MTYVVPFSGFEAPARFDGVFWTTLLVEESPDAFAVTPSWTQIDSLPVAVYTDADDPPPIDFTTDNATAASGKWYRVIFVDSNAVQSSPSDAVLNGEVTPALVTPTVADVAALLHARCVVDGEQVDTFTAETTPTATQATLLITLAVGDIMSRVRRSIPSSQVTQAKWLITVHAARLIEESYFAEQATGDDSTFAQLTTVFNPAIIEFLNACRYPLPVYMP